MKNAKLSRVGRISLKLLYAVADAFVMQIVGQRIGLGAEIIVGFLTLALYTECISKLIDNAFKKDA